MNKDVLIIIYSFCCLLVLAACSHAPKHATPQPYSKHTETSAKSTKQLSAGQKIAGLARSQVGAPYRYGGASPKGFDCSGLVYYTHGKLGINTPRTSHAQFNHARPVKFSQLESGDVVFFNINTKSISHVGIYVGNGMFVHAPKLGKKVSTNYLTDHYWKTRIVSAGRLY